jgi:hypothetical protein
MNTHCILRKRSAGEKNASVPAAFTATKTFGGVRPSARRVPKVGNAVFRRFVPVIEAVIDRRIR